MMAELPTEHVFFAIWALTQTYADFAPQVTAVLGVDRLSERDHPAAVETVTAIVLNGRGVTPRPPGQAASCQRRAGRTGSAHPPARQARTYTTPPPPRKHRN